MTRQGRLPGLPRFAVSGLHRNLSLLATAFVALHVLTAVADGYVNIPLTSAVVPLTSPYERIWLSLGAISLDLTIALIVTSLLRRHLSRRAWRAVHLLAYLSWPVAWVHSFFSSGDLQHGVLFVIALICAIAVVGAVVWRLAAAARDVPRAERVGLIMTAVHDRAARNPAKARTRGARRQRQRQDVHPMTAATAGAFHDGASRAAAPSDLPRLLPPVQEGKRPQDLAAHLARHGDLPYRDRIGTPASPGALIRRHREIGPHRPRRRRLPGPPQARRPSSRRPTGAGGPRS